MIGICRVSHILNLFSYPLFFLSYRHWKFRYFANLAVCFFYPALGPSVGDKWSECICRAAISASFSCLYGDRNTWYASMYFFPNKGPKLLWIMFTVAWVSQTLVNSWLRNLCLMVRQMFIPLWSPLQGLGPICLLKTFYSLCVAGSHWLALESLIPDGISIPAKKRQLLMINAKLIKIKVFAFLCYSLDSASIFHNNKHSPPESEENVSVFKSFIARRQST